MSSFFFFKTQTEYVFRYMDSIDEISSDSKGRLHLSIALNIKTTFRQEYLHITSIPRYKYNWMKKNTRYHNLETIHYCVI